VGLVLGEGFDDPLRRPRGRGMTRDVELHDMASFILQNQKYVEHAKGHRGTVKKSTAAIWQTWFCRKVRQVRKATWVGESCTEP
jgi:hypothetical protein